MSWFNISKFIVLKTFKLSHLSCSRLQRTIIGQRISIQVIRFNCSRRQAMVCHRIVHNQYNGKYRNLAVWFTIKSYICYLSYRYMRTSPFYRTNGKLFSLIHTADEATWRISIKLVHCWEIRNLQVACILISQSLDQRSIIILLEAQRSTNLSWLFCPEIMIYPIPETQYVMMTK